MSKNLSTQLMNDPLRDSHLGQCLTISATPEYSLPCLLATGMMDPGHVCSQVMTYVWKKVDTTILLYYTYTAAFDLMFEV